MANRPGKSHRKGISLLELAERFPPVEAAREWSGSIIWPHGDLSDAGVTKFAT